LQEVSDDMTSQLVLDLNLARRRLDRDTGSAAARA
jgi:hypothetical protein